VASFRNEELLLKVKSDFDPKILGLDQYEGFLDALCDDREYQKEAIRTVCRFLGGGQYTSSTQLAETNYAANSTLSERYGSLDGLLSALPFPEKLACSVDLATATGKSWVMYGIARILLAEGVVDRVLVLCPSLTIESGLTAKFKRFSADPILLERIPGDAVIRTPEITDANTTTGPGDICIENIAATYTHVNSSVRDSFLGKGDNTLVLNDEAHHIFSPPTGDRAIKKWKEFLDSSEFGFRRIAGFSGTCYVGNDYFADVVSRYSLRQAMEDGRVKQVEYVWKDESESDAERFQKFLKIHRQNEARHRTLKPLSILVTARVAGAETLAELFVHFLANETRISLEQAEKQVLVVTSKADHKANVAQLQYVDRKDNSIQWIFSVSMLTEGWDVQNVFQIIPHEKRAFASKLLIAQVLGRGLRVPAGLSRPTVRVFNHSSWSREIADLVAEVLEQERRLNSYPVDKGEHSKHHFELHQLTYYTQIKVQPVKRKNGDGQVNLFKRGYINFESQQLVLERTTVFIDALTKRESAQKTTVHFEAHTIAETVKRLRARLKSIDADGSTRYAKDYPSSKLRAVVEASLRRIKEKRDLVSETNLQHLFRAMGNINRPISKTVRIELKPKSIEMVSTHSMAKRSIALASLMKEATVLFDSESLEVSEDADCRALDDVSGPDTRYPPRNVRKTLNKFLFKSPVNLVLATHEPERSFLMRLFEASVADKVEHWVKAPDTGFYEVAYSWRKGDHTKQGKFNPDLFMVLPGGADVLVVELKDDDDDSDENKAKLKFAVEHFDRVNRLQVNPGRHDVRYHVKFVSPSSYDGFFQAIRDGSATDFVSNLQAVLKE
jgi:type III restriction enzyme